MLLECCSCPSPVTCDRQMAGRPKLRRTAKFGRVWPWLLGMFVLAFPSYYLFTLQLRSNVLATRSAQRSDARKLCPLHCTSTDATEKRNFRRLAVVRPFIESQLDRLVSSIQQWEDADLFPCAVPAKLAAASDARPVLILYFNRRSRDSARVRALAEHLNQVPLANL